MKGGEVEEPLFIMFEFNKEIKNIVIYVEFLKLT